MTEWILSVGIDVGTSTTQVVFSRLQVENIASSFSVPRIMIVDKRIVFRSEIHTTPLISPDEIDAEALKQIVIDEYEKAGFQPADVGTGAAIITGETARAENAEQVLSALSELAGDFVVATAGPHLESVLAARGAGIDEYSAHARGVIANLDIGGGTTNIAAYEHGQLLGTSCLDIGGRLVRISPDRRITYVSPQIVKLAASAGIPLAVGDQANAERLRALTRVMARHLAMSIGLVERHEPHLALYTNEGKPLRSSITPTSVSFSGGVADLIDGPHHGDPFRFGDIGPLLGASIDEDSAFKLIQRHQATETIGATVVGAGVHTTEISGSTIDFGSGLLPIRNVPILRIPPEIEENPELLTLEISERLATMDPDHPEQTVAIALDGHSLRSFADIQRLAQSIIDGAKVVLEGPNPLVVVLESDRAKVLGQSLAVQRGRRDDLICIDSVQTANGDFIDIGTPVGAGRAVPVVVKTLVFND